MERLNYSNFLRKSVDYLSIKELCSESPILIINTVCGIGKYQFNMITFDDKDRIILKFKLVKDTKYKDIDRIKYNLGKYYYMSAKQFLYAFKHVANS